VSNIENTFKDLIRLAARRNGRLLVNCPVGYFIGAMGYCLDARNIGTPGTGIAYAYLNNPVKKWDR
jgi:hypothetical protein